MAHFVQSRLWKGQKNPTYPVTRDEISQGQHAFMPSDTVTFLL